MKEIKLSCAATYCQNCKTIVSQHRLGCSSCSGKEKSFNLTDVAHGFIIETERQAIHLEDFISSNEVINHVKDKTAKVFYNGKEITIDQV